MLRGTVDELIPQMLKLDRTKIYVLDKDKKPKQKRTLTANSYYWVLLGKLAKVLRTSNEELHEQLIKRYSHTIDYFSTLAEVDITKYGIKYFDVSKTYKSRGKIFKSYIVYKPSSQMDKEEFSYLLDGLISECKEAEIETLTPDQLLELKSRWKDAI